MVVRLPAAVLLVFELPGACFPCVQPHLSGLWCSLHQNGPCVVPGHCIIAPLEHIQSMRDADEDVQREVERFKQALEKVGGDNEESYIFMESAVDYHKHKHAYIECVPMEKELAFDAPMYFSKVCQTVGVSWPGMTEGLADWLWACWLLPKP